MSKTSFIERARRAADAFFQTETYRGRNEALTYTGETAIFPIAAPAVTETAAKWIWNARSLVLFGPGTFFLFYITLAFTDLVAQFPELALDPLAYFWLVAASFMVYAGSGSIKKLRNAAVPASVIAMALAVAAIAAVLPLDRGEVYFGYSIYAFPFVLIAAKFVEWAVSHEF